MPTSKSENNRKEIPPLLYPPLIEAIFELHWELEEVKQTQRLRDPAYPMLYGRMYERLKKDFPYMEDLPSTQAHPEATPYVVRHRIRRAKNGYPLIQVGPGIATVNEAAGYSWTSMRASCLRAAETILDLYPTEMHPLNFMKCEIRYLNGIRLDSEQNPLAFLAEKLHMKVEVDPVFFIGNEVEENPHSVSLNLAYNLKKPVGHLALSAQLGQMEGKPAYIVQTLIQSTGEMVPAEGEGFGQWLNEAHAVAENCFQAFCRGPLLEKFCGA
jgi:uncharacterized protein (TIGR04255 family)